MLHAVVSTGRIVVEPKSEAPQTAEDSRISRVGTSAVEIAADSIGAGLSKIAVTTAPAAAAVPEIVTV